MLVTTRASTTGTLVRWEKYLIQCKVRQCNLVLGMFQGLRDKGGSGRYLRSLRRNTIFYKINWHWCRARVWTASISLFTQGYSCSARVAPAYPGYCTFDWHLICASHFVMELVLQKSGIYWKSCCKHIVWRQKWDFKLRQPATGISLRGLWTTFHAVVVMLESLQAFRDW